MSVRDALIAMARRPEDGGAVLAGLPPTEGEEALRAAVVHGLGTSAAIACHDARTPVPDWLEAHRFDMANRRAHILAALAAVAPALTAADIPWAVLKGPVVATYHPDPTLREFVDLDILVPGGRVADTIAALGAAGAQHINRNWEGALRHGVAEFPAFVAGMPIDVHWHLVGLRRDRRRFRLPVAAMLERAQPVDLGGVACRRLDAVDNAIHLAVHEGRGGAWRLAGLRDVHVTVAAGLDWGIFVDRARTYGVAPLVGQVLDRCRQALETPVPDDVTAALAPAVALRARRWVDRRYGHGPEQPFSGIVVSVARQGVAATLAAAAGQLAERARGVLGKGSRWSAYDPGGPLYWDRGSTDRSAFDAYCRMAAAEG